MIFRYGSFLLQRGEYALIAIPLVFLTLLLLRMRFLKDREYYRKKGKYRTSIIFFRVLIFLLLSIALALPAIEETSVPNEVPKIKVIIDNTSSMRIFDSGDISSFADKLKSQGIVVDIDYLSTGTETNLGDEILRKIEPNSNLLVISDFDSNSGTSLEDVSLFASSVKAKIYGIKLKESETDASVRIEGPSKVVAGVQNSFKVIVSKAGRIPSVHVLVKVDGTTVYDQKTSDDELDILQTFDSGEHRISAELIDNEDAFPENDVFYKSVYVVKKPPILFVTADQNAPILKIVRELYDVDVTDRLPEKLDKYYAVILDNIPASGLTDKSIETLSTYLEDENGLFVIGGKNSYDWGDYNKSLITNLLPVQIGHAKKKRDVANIIIAIDSGVSAAGLIESKTSSGDVQFIEIEKALAIDVVDTIASTSKVGVIESNIYPSIISRPSELGPKKQDIDEKIKNLKLHDASALRGSVLNAADLLRFERGSKNLIIITDGIIGYYDQVETLKNIEKAYQDGIVTFTVGVGQNASTEFLRKAAEIGHGKYFQTDQVNRLNILFGDQENLPKDNPELFIYDSTHFITQGIDSAGKVDGYNSVYPKASANLLVTTMSGDPVLTVWRYGLGRVAALSTDDGSSWASPVMSRDNSVFLIRSINWVIGEPERKSNLSINFPDMTVNKSSEITVKSVLYPESKELHFTEEKKDVYTAYYVPYSTGFLSLMNHTVASNYQDEFRDIGQNPKAGEILGISQGELLEDDPSSAADRLKSISKVETTRTIDMQWIFILAAIAIYLAELLIRRIFEIVYSRRQD